MNTHRKHFSEPYFLVTYIIRLLVAFCTIYFLWMGGLFTHEKTELLVSVFVACAHLPVCLLMYRIMFKRVYIVDNSRLVHNMEKTGHLSHLAGKIVGVTVWWFITMIVFLWTMVAKPENVAMMMSITVWLCVWTAIEAVSTLRKLNIVIHYLKIESEISV